LYNQDQPIEEEGKLAELAMAPIHCPDLDGSLKNMSFSLINKISALEDKHT